MQLLRQLIAIEPLIVLFVTIDLGDLIGKIKVGRLPSRLVLDQCYEDFTMKPEPERLAVAQLTRSSK